MLSWPPTRSHTTITILYSTLELPAFFKICSGRFFRRRERKAERIGVSEIPPASIAPIYIHNLHICQASFTITFILFCFDCSACIHPLTLLGLSGLAKMYLSPGCFFALEEGTNRREVSSQKQVLFPFGN
jgi:hypothetical protein